MTVIVHNIDLYLHNLRTRLPFQYGIAVMTALPQLFVHITCGINGMTQAGMASDVLPPKWFTKDPNTSFRDDIADMLRVTDMAARFAKDVKVADTVFELWRRIYAEQKRWAEGEGYPPLLWNFGVSLIERAIIDAFCRATGTTLAEALRTNTFGVRLGTLYDELDNIPPAYLLPLRPLRSIIVRHTVGLADPLIDRKIAAEERLDDGLPQSLEACIRAYGLTYFKIKVGGDKASDFDRLRQIAAILENSEISDFAFTLDGNEQYENVGSFREFWQEVTTDSSLAPLMSRLLFAEQPLPRDIALTAETRESLTQWDERPPIIIDESDDLLDSLKIALDCGYAGTSHKNCKGIFKGLANACLLEQRRRADPDGLYLLSGEDLANIGPIALLQDLAMMANLGVEHVERNGHHYFAGLSMFAPKVQEEILSRHQDLYRRHERDFATMNIQNGRIAVESVIEAPFGVNFEVELSQFTPRTVWNFDSLEH